MLDTRNETNGSDDTVLSDGWWNAIRERRASLPGLVGWDLGFLYLGLVAMDAPQAEIDWVYASLVDLGAEMLALDPETDYVPLSLAQLGVVYARELETAPIAVDVMDALLAYDDGTGLYVDHQTTAYACMAFAESGLEAEWAMSCDRLRSQIDARGRLIEEDGYVYFEVLGEVLQALLR